MTLCKLPTSYQKRKVPWDTNLWSMACPWWQSPLTRWPIQCHMFSHRHWQALGGKIQYSGAVYCWHCSCSQTIPMSIWHEHLGHAAHLLDARCQLQIFEGVTNSSSPQQTPQALFNLPNQLRDFYRFYSSNICFCCMIGWCETVWKLQQLQFFKIGCLNLWGYVHIKPISYDIIHIAHIAIHIAHIAHIPPYRPYTPYTPYRYISYISDTYRYISYGWYGLFRMI